MTRPNTTRRLPKPNRSLLLASLLLCLPSPASSATLVENGQPKSCLVLSPEAYNSKVVEQTKRGRRAPLDPVALERRAAEEIQLHLRGISGATIEIVQADTVPEHCVPVFIGSAADVGLEDKIRRLGDDPSSFALVVNDDSVSIRGLSAEGTLFGAYEALEQLGVRWFMPGELGLVLPQAETVRLKRQRTIQLPSFPARRLQDVRAPEWESRMRLAGMHFPAAHGVRGFGHGNSQLFDEHPEYFSLIDEERKARQLCVSNPEVVALAIEATREYFRANPDAHIMGIGANDGRGFCECDECLALDGGDYDPFGHYPSMTDRYVWFFNQVLEGIADEFPKKRLGFYAYSVYNRPPVKVKPDARLVPAVALITLCRLHGMDNPSCPEKSYEKWIIREWGRLVPEVYYRGYWYNLADPGLPFFMVGRIGREVPLGKELGIAGWRVEACHQWAGSTPSRYIAAKLMWDHTASVDALMADFYAKFFGPVADPMRRYIETMSGALEEADYHTGSSWDMPHVYPAAVRAEARLALDEAMASKFNNALYSRRVSMYARSLDYLDAFVAMLESRARHDWAASHTALQQIHAIREELSAQNPPLIGRHAESYMRRFFSQTTEQGYERTTGGNELAAGLDDTWSFQIDPEQIGEAVGWWRPEHAGGNWQTIKTSTCSWSNQGLRYYKGLAWYRQTVDVPTKYQGKRIFLWFGGIDELAKVWLNGELVSISPKASFVPFELDATDAVRPGQANQVTVCISNMTLNELGTGGITGPVMFYSPVGGKDAELQNAKALHAVFPEY